MATAASASNYYHVHVREYQSLSMYPASCVCVRVRPIDLLNARACPGTILWKQLVCTIVYDAYDSYICGLAN
jgi:hypothetical protein